MEINLRFTLALPVAHNLRVVQQRHPSAVPDLTDEVVRILNEAKL